MKLWAGCSALTQELEQAKHLKVERSWNNWLFAFNILLPVVVQAQPWMTSVLMTFLDSGHRVFSSFLSSAWFKYDEMF